jgi:CheY-like chemotaxis protein
MHGGSIEARSEGLGTGSEFIVRMPIMTDAPLVTPPLPPRTGRDAAPIAPANNGARVLAVDDNGDALEAVATLLRMAGHAVETAADGEAAIEKARSLRPDVMLLDIGLPGVDGYDVARWIRSEPWGGDVLLVAMTGWGQPKDKRQAQEAGFNTHLTKPIDAEELERVLASRPGSLKTNGLH